MDFCHKLVTAHPPPPHPPWEQEGSICVKSSGWGPDCSDGVLPLFVQALCELDKPLSFSVKLGSSQPFPLGTVVRITHAGSSKDLRSGPDTPSSLNMAILLMWRVHSWGRGVFLGRIKMVLILLLLE